MAPQSPRLLVTDMDSTLIAVEVIDELARAHGVYGEVARVTSQAMEGGLDFEESLHRRVALLKGLSEQKALEVCQALPFSPGAEVMVQGLKQAGYRIVLVSGGFTMAAKLVQSQLGLDQAHANTLEIEGGHLTGRVTGPVVGPAQKVEILEKTAKQYGVPMEHTVALGDGANDRPMLKRAGTGIAYHPKPCLMDCTPHHIHTGGLEQVLGLVGLHGNRGSR